MLDWLMPAAMAQEAGQGAAPNPLPGTLMMMAVMFGIMYFVWLRPQEKEARRHREMLSNLKKGDRVVTSGGIHGRVHSLSEDTVKLEIADKVRIDVSRANIARRIGDEVAK